MRAAEGRHRGHGARQAQAERAAADAAAADGDVGAEDDQEEYCCFLSHYKVEAGSDARYLSDLIRRMVGVEAFLDSANLDDLSKLFSDGVHKSATLVLLATENVLKRPWCLLELWEAHRKRLPVIVMPIAGRNFEAGGRALLLNNLEERRRPTRSTR